jgi:DNA-directed RNA polymerase specialized sigma subunit
MDCSEGRIRDVMKAQTKEDETLSIEAANELVLEHQGWAESIARSVARAWNMDWQLDGLDGAAMEALIFCARRYQPNRGVPFKGYARRRIHEASTEAARKSKGWKRSLAAMPAAEQRAREISADLFNIFPELRTGELPDSGDAKGDMRGAVRQLLMGAALLSAR